MKEKRQTTEQTGFKGRVTAPKTGFDRSSYPTAPPNTSAKRRPVRSAQSERIRSSQQLSTTLTVDDNCDEKNHAASHPSRQEKTPAGAGIFLCALILME